MSLPGRPLSVHHDIVVYTRAPTCLNRSMTDNDFQRIQELLTTNFNAMEERNAERFDKIDKRLDGMERRLDKIDTLSKDIESQHQDALEAKGALRLLTTQHEQLSGRVAVIESRLQAA